MKVLNGYHNFETTIICKNIYYVRKEQNKSSNTKERKYINNKIIGETQRELKMKQNEKNNRDRWQYTRSKLGKKE